MQKKNKSTTKQTVYMDGEATGLHSSITKFMMLATLHWQILISINEMHPECKQRKKSNGNV